MNELIEFLTSAEIIVVYVVAALACLLCFIIYLVDKNSDKRKKKNNTRELNKLVEQVKEVSLDEPEITTIYEQPVLHVIEEDHDAVSVEELLESTLEIEKKNIVPEVKPLVVESTRTNNIFDDIEETPVIIETIEDEEDALEYTTIEPDQETARLELKKITEELKKQQELEEMKPETVVSRYETAQEENAIIGLDELMKKSKEMYEANEVTQYADEGNEPISLQDLEKTMEMKVLKYDEPFIIDNVVPVAEVNAELEDFKKENAPVITEVKEVKKFVSSPIISPIFGIEKKESVSSTELELENTANYDKLDQEIKKTNEFIMTLKELQKHLD